ncbi:MAG: hypothetical protein ACRCX2_15015 [Paraclostridium sp.]
MTDRQNTIYDVVKIGYDVDLDTIKSNSHKIMEREMVINTSTPEIIIKVNGKLYKVKLEEVV